MSYSLEVGAMPHKVEQVELSALQFWRCAAQSAVRATGEQLAQHLRRALSLECAQRLPQA
jgi:hypothetical protein